MQFYCTTLWKWFNLVYECILKQFNFACGWWLTLTISTPYSISSQQGLYWIMMKYKIKSNLQRKLVSIWTDIKRYWGYITVHGLIYMLISVWPGGHLTVIMLSCSDVVMENKKVSVSNVDPVCVSVYVMSVCNTWPSIHHGCCGHLSTVGTGHWSW